MSCKWYNICPLRGFERKGKIDKSWSRSYCETIGNWRNCKRYQLEEKGIYHPDNMMPDGAIDESIFARGD
jgi:hypothetical protein